MDWEIQLFKSNYNHFEQKAVKKVLANGWLTMGAETNAFEKEFAVFLKGSGLKTTALSSCTAALHLSLLALGIGSGDEVIIPALTFAADINVVKMVGASVRLADCCSHTNWNVSAETIAPLITAKTKAVIIVHYAGWPCEMDGITKLCREKNIALIEDTAHAPGAFYKGKACGTFGDFGCFSFFGNKNLSVGEGGLIAAHSEELMQKVHYLRSHGMTSLSLDRHQGRATTYDIVCPGLNYRFDEIRAAIGRVQLVKQPDIIAKRKSLTRHYTARLKENPAIAIPFADISESAGLEAVYHIMPVMLDKEIDRAAVIEHLKNRRIQSSIHYPSFAGFSAFKNSELGTAPIANEISARELTLPLYPEMSFEQADKVCDALCEAVK